MLHFYTPENVKKKRGFFKPMFPMTPILAQCPNSIPRENVRKRFSGTIEMENWREMG